MAVTTHSFKYKPTTAPSGTEDRVLACSHTTDDCHCVINASGQIGYYVSGVFTQIGTATVSLNEQYSFIIEHDTSGNGCIYLNGQKIGCATNFPTTAINQIGNFKTELKPETGRKPKVGLKPRAVSNIYARPCCGVIDEYARFNRALSASEVVDLSQSGTLSKVYTLADYKIALMADDGIIATTEKPRYKENWRSIWNADQRTSALPTAIASITVNGSYKSLATSANDAGIWTPTTNGTPSYDYYQAVESWRKMFFVSSGGGTGFLLTANLAGDSDISSMSPTLEARQSALMFAEDALRSAVMIKRQSIAELTAVANANNSVVAYAPKYLGRYYQSHPGAPNNGDWWLVYGVASSPVTRGFWYNNNGNNTLVSTLGTEAQRKYKGSGLEDVLYASNNGYALTSGGVYDPVGIYGVSTMEFLAVNQAFIEKLMTRELELQSGGKLFSGTGSFNNSNTPIFLGYDGATAKFSLKNLLSFDGTNLNITGRVVSHSGIGTPDSPVDGDVQIYIDNGQWYSRRYDSGLWISVSYTRNTSTYSQGSYYDDAAIVSKAFLTNRFVCKDINWRDTGIVIRKGQVWDVAVTGEYVWGTDPISYVAKFTIGSPYDGHITAGTTYANPSSPSQLIKVLLNVTDYSTIHIRSGDESTQFYYPYAIFDFICHSVIEDSDIGWSLTPAGTFEQII